jgi:maltooligosyltrehalose trehalohydrolase
MKRVHRMPFGAEIDEQGHARFSLWAPTAKDVVLETQVNDTATRTPMRARANGWYETIMPAVGAGVRYRYRIDDELDVPDPASRFNPEGVHGWSLLVDPTRFDWQDEAWRGHDWHELVIYELHVGTFTQEGTYAALIERLPDLARLGITALELLPLASFAGARGWGYDGVLQFAPHPAYGSPDDLKRLIQCAHEHEISVLLDVVYNHFGPDGNYLGRYAGDFFTSKHHTPWGDAIDFSNHTVRQFFIQNALYWIDEYRFDGLRLDAVHAIYDDGPRHFIDELIDAVQDGPGRERRLHIVLENHSNEACRLRRPRVLQWNDDFHHAAHVLITGEHESYYADFAERPIEQLGRSLAEGFVFQGERSAVSGKTRGESSKHLTPLAFVNFLQNHDQTGNRACGERLAQLAEPASLEAALAILILAPQVPMLFMGEEYAAPQPFLYFCDYTGELAEAVREGRRAEFAAFASFSSEAVRERIPDPNDASTFIRSTLIWTQRDEPEHKRWLDLTTRLLGIRRRTIMPIIPDLELGRARYEIVGNVLRVTWPTTASEALSMIANLSNDRAPPPAIEKGSLVFSTEDEPSADALHPWEVRVFAAETSA